MVNLFRSNVEITRVEEETYGDSNRINLTGLRTNYKCVKQERIVLALMALCYGMLGDR